PSACAATPRSWTFTTAPAAADVQDRGAYARLTPARGRIGPVRVLGVGGEGLRADAILEGLRRESLAVDVAYDGDAALQRVGVNDYDVVVLDRDLPRVHGDDVCAAVLEKSDAR